MDRRLTPSQLNKSMFVTVALAIILGAGTLLFLILITGGLFVAVAAALAVMAAVGAFHYLIWGYALSKEVGLQPRPVPPPTEPRRR